MGDRTGLVLAAAAAFAIAPGAGAFAQDMAPVAADGAVPTVTAPPAGFTSAAQARAYLSASPTGARAEAAFSTVASADIAARNPDLDAGQIALGSALEVQPTALATPDEIEAVINATTPAIGARRGLF